MVAFIAMPRRVVKKTREDFAKVAPRDGIVDAVKNQLARQNITGETIQLCFTCDPYPAEIDTKPTRDVIEAIKNAGNHVQILTKGGHRALRDFDLLDSGDYFGVTISAGTKETKANEPRAACVAERITSLVTAHQKGIKTWISCEPVFDVAAVYRLIGNANYIDLFKIGKTNYVESSIDWGDFGRECERLCQLHGREFYIKDDLRKEMGLKP